MITNKYILKANLYNLKPCHLKCTILLLLLFSTVKGFDQKNYTYPTAIKSNVTDNYFGTLVPYLLLVREPAFRYYRKLVE